MVVHAIEVFDVTVLYPWAGGEELQSRGVAVPFGGTRDKGLPCAGRRSKATPAGIVFGPAEAFLSDGVSRVAGRRP